MRTTYTRQNWATSKTIVSNLLLEESVPCKVIRNIKDTDFDTIDNFRRPKAQTAVLRDRHTLSARRTRRKPYKRIDLKQAKPYSDKEG
jgi:hypothetical protein